MSSRVNNDTTRVEKHQETLALVARRVTAVMKAATAENLEDAYRQVFAADPALFDAYRKATYSTGSPGLVPRDGMQKAAPVSPAYQEAQRIAAQMKEDDVYGKYKDQDEDAMLGVVFESRPDLYRAYRAEVLSQR
jgi:hypothetical protein